MRATAASSVRTVNEDKSQGVPTGTLLTLLWAFSTLFWSIFTPPHKTLAARVLLFQPWWALRIYWSDATWLQDLILFLSSHAVYSYWTGAWRMPHREDLHFLDPTNNTTHLYYQIFLLLAACGLFAGGIVFRGHHLRSMEHNESLYAQPIDEQVLPPLLFSSKTTHTRLFPQKHAFSYTYLLVGVPVGIQGRISRILSVDAQKPAWFSVNAEDYLQRGRAEVTLAHKLKSYLHTQDVTDRDYALAYLVTAPRFLGYSFNPVSFWYLYDSDTQLKYVILEVNNTFNERRMYLLRAVGTKVVKNGTKGDLSGQHLNGSTMAQTEVVFNDVWDKDFHVSPFNSRNGSYTLRATDPLGAYERTGLVRIDNTIVLRSSEEHPKIVARVWSESKPEDPAKMTAIESIRFIATWCWVGFATLPRIVWEASKLFFQRKLPLWNRPEVTKHSIGRPYTADELILEAFFRAFLSHVVSEASKPLRVVYEPAHSESPEIVLYSPGFTYEEDHKRTLTLNVQSPAFYSRFIHYEHAKVALEKECLTADEKNRTAVIEHMELLPILLDAIDGTWRETSKRPPGEYSIEPVRWACMRRLRCPPPGQPYPSTLHSLEGRKSSWSSSPQIDQFARSCCEDSAVYRRVVTKIFFAQRLALGVSELLVALDLTIRFLLLSASMLYCDNSKAVDVLQPRKLDASDIKTVATMLLLANSVHIWSLTKG
ncbi:hypothetical protein BAUCODRAFT_38441 [Baudoinia panamericana UAMH 10762]|uniref:DUF1365-domain-containing protein n=1 Tax=Baudoinia panamericana (strain UAMH 10762) TaxID=717646 RepID=M2N0C3_BAUPA|nr:uncharacterized protein BAUCODRAFT_38441 [Baudoinia panamericana UAMH 10762]EMC92389.1 hypothetical protein BAUCODRAFT_38441 [Baudoinia panamericana UAMH 10762]